MPNDQALGDMELFNKIISAFPQQVRLVFGYNCTNSWSSAIEIIISILQKEPFLPCWENHLVQKDWT
jgi:hypothetical protein